jgi:hypothetical protein
MVLRNSLNRLVQSKMTMVLVTLSSSVQAENFVEEPSLVPFA